MEHRNVSRFETSVQWNINSTVMLCGWGYRRLTDGREGENAGGTGGTDGAGRAGVTDGTGGTGVGIGAGVGGETNGPWVTQSASQYTTEVV